MPITTSTQPSVSLGLGQEPGQDLHPDREAGEAIGEGLEVLLGQKSGRHQHSRLLAVLHRLEHGADRHLGLAEPHVPTHQPVHGHAVFHVLLDVDDGLELVGRLGVREGLLRLPLPGAVGGEGVSRRGDAAAVEHDELLGDLPDRGAHPGSGALPFRAPQAVDGRRLAPGVGLDGVDLVGGDVELVAAAVLQEEVVAFRPGDGPGDHAAVAGDAVLVVHDEVARLEVVEEALREPGAGARPAVGPPAPGEVSLGQHRQPQGGQHEAPLQGLDHDPSARCGQVGGLVDHRQADPLLPQDGGQPRRAPGALGAHGHAVAV